MSECRLACGDTEIRLERPDELAWTTVVPRERAADPESAPAADAIARGILAEWESLEPAKRHPRNAVVAVPDGTRRFPHAEVVSGVAAALEQLGVPGERILFLVAGGVHRGEPPQELVRAARRTGAAVASHDAASPCLDVGVTAAGTAVSLDRSYLEAELRVAVGGTSLHYFAGFGGGPKMVFPGLAGRLGVAQNHRLSLAPLPPGGLAEGCAPARIVGNPVARDLEEAAGLRPAEVALHLVPRNGSFDVEAGKPGLARARRTLLQAAAVGERGAADCVAASAGGAPLDGDLVQAHKALFHAASYCRPGGVILLAARLDRGAGSASLERWLGSEDDAALERDARAHYDLNAQTAISLRRLCARHTVLWLGACETAWVRRAGAEPMEEPRLAWATARSRALSTGSYERAVHLPAASAVVPADAAAWI